MEDAPIVWGGEFGRTTYTQGVDGRDRRRHQGRRHR